MENAVSPNSPHLLPATTPPPHVRQISFRPCIGFPMPHLRHFSLFLLTSTMRVGGSITDNGTGITSDIEHGVDMNTSFTFMMGMSSISRTSIIQNESGRDVKVQGKARSVLNESQIWHIPNGQKQEVRVQGRIITDLVVKSKEGHDILMVIPRACSEKSHIVFGSRPAYIQGWVRAASM